MVRVVNKNRSEAYIDTLWMVRVNVGGGLHKVKKLKWKGDGIYGFYSDRSGNYIYDPRTDKEVNDGYLSFLFETEEEAKKSHGMLKAYIDMLRNGPLGVM